MIDRHHEISITIGSLCSDCNVSSVPVWTSSEASFSFQTSSLPPGAQEERDILWPISLLERGANSLVVTVYQTVVFTDRIKPTIPKTCPQYLIKTHFSPGQLLLYLKSKFVLRRNERRSLQKYGVGFMLALGAEILTYCSQRLDITMLFGQWRTMAMLLVFTLHQLFWQLQAGGRSNNLWWNTVHPISIMVGCYPAMWSFNAR